MVELSILHTMVCVFPRLSSTCTVKGCESPKTRLALEWTRSRVAAAPRIYIESRARARMYQDQVRPKFELIELGDPTTRNPLTHIYTYDRTASIS